MRCERVTIAGDQLFDPAAKAWDGIAAENVGLQNTPVHTIPSRYVRDTVDPKSVGKVSTVRVRSAHDGNEIFFLLDWDDASRDDDVSETHKFTDGAGVLFPLRGMAPIETMGSPLQPVNAWYWRADEKTPLNVTATGLGTTERSKQSPIRAQAAWSDGRWRVVLRRPLRVEESGNESVQLAPGDRTRVGFAVWEGANRERGGTKAFSGRWIDLEIAA